MSAVDRSLKYDSVYNTVPCALLCRIATAWAGDSRMVLGRQATNEDGETFMQALELTEDHKPDNPGECKRIHAAGGRVQRLISGTATYSGQLACLQDLGLLVMNVGLFG